GDATLKRSLHNYANGKQTVPLSHIEGSTYSYNVGGANPPSSLTDLYTSYRPLPSSSRTVTWHFSFMEMATLLATYFRNKEILFMKVTQTWSPGKFVYRSSTRPKVKRVYKAACLEWRNTASAAAAARRAALARNGLRHRPRGDAGTSIDRRSLLLLTFM
ncbi:hypothetical protein FOZ60_017222, partial [Perkinsus olseni]